MKKLTDAQKQSLANDLADMIQQFQLRRNIAYGIVLDVKDINSIFQTDLTKKALKLTVYNMRNYDTSQNNAKVISAIEKTLEANHIKPFTLIFNAYDF